MTPPMTPRESKLQKVQNALASGSGSGDHAELAEIATRCEEHWLSGPQEEGAIGVVVRREQLEALLAENAALRDREKSALKECSDWARQAGEAIGKLEASEMAGVVDGWRDRSTEAERKLAEAVGLLRECLPWVRKITDLYGRVSAWLSKEAERG